MNLSEYHIEKAKDSSGLSSSLALLSKIRIWLSDKQRMRHPFAVTDETDLKGQLEDGPSDQKENTDGSPCWKIVAPSNY